MKFSSQDLAKHAEHIGKFDIRQLACRYHDAAAEAKAATQSLYAVRDQALRTCAQPTLRWVILLP